MMYGETGTNRGKKHEIKDTYEVNSNFLIKFIQKKNWMRGNGDHICAELIMLASLRVLNGYKIRNQNM